MLDKTEESRWVNIMGLLQRLENNLAGYMKKKVVDIAHKGIRALRNNEIDQIGELLHENWEQKKQFASNVSNQQLDDIYDAGKSAGALGGKVLGAGGGGFFLFYCEPKYQSQVRRALCKLKETQFMFEGQGSKIIYVNNGNKY
jgi:D-glycero-alpha-D-manno-heptose-7-phosphate kinase